jgi:hypothetical protein
MMYDIPVEQWDTLNDAQRLEAIKGHNERELLRQQERLCAHEARAVAAETFIRGEAGRYGDLMKIAMRNGTTRFDGTIRWPSQSLVATSSAFIDPKSEHAFNEATRLVYEPDWKDDKTHVCAVQQPQLHTSEQYE